MKGILILIAVLFLSLSLTAQEEREYDGVQAIKELHNGWLVVRLPAFEKKFAVIDSLLEKTQLSDASRAKLEHEKMRTEEMKAILHKWYPIMFDSFYTFSAVAFIYTHETHGFQSGQIRAKNAQGEPIDSVHMKHYLFATLNGTVRAPFLFTSRDHRVPGPPFPSSIGLPRTVISVPMADWIRSIEEDLELVYKIYRHVLRVNRKLSTFYRRKKVQSALD